MVTVAPGLDARDSVTEIQLIICLIDRPTAVPAHPRIENFDRLGKPIIFRQPELVASKRTVRSEIATVKLSRVLLGIHF